MAKTGLELKIHGLNRIASLVDEKKLIRREVVSMIDKIYDPFDLLAPSMIKLKMLLQKLTKETGAMLEEMVLMEDVTYPAI